MTPEPPDPEGSPDGTVPEGSPEGTVQDQVFDMVQRSQESIIDATRNFADGMSDLVPASREQVDKVIDSAFDLTEKVLQIQRDFAKSVVRTVTPPIGGSDDDDNG
jgi:hypothetical protein